MTEPITEKELAEIIHSWHPAKREIMRPFEGARRVYPDGSMNETLYGFNLKNVERMADEIWRLRTYILYELAALYCASDKDSLTDQIEAIPPPSVLQLEWAIKQHKNSARALLIAKQQLEAWKIL